MAWAKNGTPLTLGSALDDMDITDLGGLKFNHFLWHRLNSGTAGGDFTINDDGGSNYARRWSYNGGTDGTSTSQTSLPIYANDSTPNFVIGYAIGISTEEKLVIAFNIEQNTAGAGTAPNRAEFALKWANTADSITRIDINNAGIGSFDTSSNLTALGTD